MQITNLLGTFRDRALQGSKINVLRQLRLSQEDALLQPISQYEPGLSVCDLFGCPEEHRTLIYIRS